MVDLSVAETALRGVMKEAVQSRNLKEVEKVSAALATIWTLMGVEGQPVPPDAVVTRPKFGKTRKAVEVLFDEGRKVREIAASLGLTRCAVTAHIAHIRRSRGIPVSPRLAAAGALLAVVNAARRNANGAV